MKTNTICALCTPVGKSALSVIRISGPKALEITKKQASFLPQKPQSHHCYVGTLKKKDQDIDQVLVTFFEQGRSFTGEESLEISCHGGMVYHEVLNGLLDGGACLAKRGEFSMQALANGKMDLLQVEALLNLIESQNQNSRRQALKQLKGSLSKLFEDLEKQWMFVLSHLEADIDFSTEDLDLIDEEHLEKEILKMQKNLQKLLAQYRPAEQIEKGLTCGFFGPVNGGKSSLFNALLEEEKAIVSDEEGTTRDIVEDTLFYDKGLNLRLKDTAGFRFTSSEGEKKGQQKALEVLGSCDIALFVFDSLEDFKFSEKLFFDKTNQNFLLFTKKDLCDSKLQKKDLIKKWNLQNQQTERQLPEDQIFFLSSKTKEGVQSLKDKLFSLANINEQDDFFIGNYRHYEALKKMEEACKKTLEILKEGLGERDLMALEMRQGLLFLYELLGKQIEDQVLDKIFKQFCIGK